jgi:serine/threonine-protein kinase RsbW
LHLFHARISKGAATIGLRRELTPCATVAAMTPDTHCAFEARMACLPQAVAFVAAFCERSGIGRDDTLRLTLIVEELFTNTVMHGHGADSPERVRLTLQAHAAHVELLYEDAAPPFDPWSALAGASAELQADLADRPVGHLGIALVLQMASRVSHVHEEGRNRLRLVVSRAGPPS